MPLIRKTDLAKRSPGAFETYRATTTQTISKGELVRVLSISEGGAYYEVVKALGDGSQAGKLMVATIDSGTDGHLLVAKADLLTLDTSAGALGDPVYLSASAAGELTLTASLEQVGTVTLVGTAGTVGAAPFISSVAREIAVAAAVATPESNVVADPGDGNPIPVGATAAIWITTGASGETNTLPNPTEAGLELLLAMDVDGGGDRVITTATVVDGVNNTLTFSTAAQWCLLRSTQIQVAGSPVYLWALAINFGVGLS